MDNRADSSLWADTPFALLKIPGQPGGPVCVNSGVLNVAIEMANVHNVLLRPLNAIYHQAPFIRIPVDVADFMLYITAWADTLHHHHSLEESLFFPMVEKIAKEAGIDDCEGIMGGNVDQHHEFEPKIAELVKWAEEVVAGKKTYDAVELKRQIDDFAPILTQHLHDEIGTLVKLENCDGEKIKQAMKETADEGARTADPNLVIPLVLGSIDRGYPGSENFPPLPFFVPYLNAYWFTRKHKGSWRFNPSDHWGNPRPLHFLQ
jgi:hemerythrin-like domain-containing protein